MFMLASYDDWLEDRAKLLDCVATYMATGLTVDGIYAIPRGGLFIGMWLSNKTGLPLLLAPTQHSIVIDDIIDSGSTIEQYFQKWRQGQRPYIVAWYINKERKEDLVAKGNIVWFREKEAKDWVEFFWEV